MVALINAAANVGKAKSAAAATSTPTRRIAAS